MYCLGPHGLTSFLYHSGGLNNWKLGPKNAKRAQIQHLKKGAAPGGMGSLERPRARIDWN